MKNKIDLHVHTCYSDGTKTPKEVVELAKERKLKAIAISDHDVISGINEAVQYGTTLGIEILSGIEFSAKVDCSKDSIHLLGYLFDIENPKIKEFSDSMEKIKKEVTLKKINLANKFLKVNITYDEISKKTKGIPGTPHIAMALLDKGYVKKFEDGIKLFTKGGPCCIKSKDKIHAKDAIKIIHDAGGIAVLAHLFAYRYENKFASKEEQEELLKELKSYGLNGVEIFIPTLTEKELVFGNQLSKKYNLIQTGGSDFHDEYFIPTNRLGSLNLSYAIVEEMKKCQTKLRN